MQTNFTSILEKFGFSKHFDFYDTTLAFNHEVYNYLDDANIFIPEKTLVEQHPENRAALVTCELTCTPNTNLKDAISYLQQQWTNTLRYENPFYEDINVTMQDTKALVSCITIAKNTACTFIFTINTGMKIPNMTENYKAENKLSSAEQDEGKAGKKTDTPIVQPINSDDSTTLSSEAQRMLDTMDSTFDDPDFVEKLVQARAKREKQ